MNKSMGNIEEMDRYGLSKTIDNYKQERKKDVTHQIIAGSVSLFLFVTSIINIYLIFILLQGDIPRLFLARQGFVFLLMILISTFEIVRLRLFYSWGNAVNSESGKLVDIHEKLIANSKKIIGTEMVVIVLIILFLTGWFLFRIAFLAYIEIQGIPITMTNYGIAFQLFIFTSTTTFIIGLIQLVLSLIILVCWIRRLNRINHRFESIEGDFPNIGELEDSLEDS